MYNDEILSLDLVWQADGHLTEIAFAALGDGEDHLLPEGVLEHATACLRCSEGLGQGALLSLRTGEALRDHAALDLPAPSVEPAPQPMTPPLPVTAIVAALLLSALGAAPALVAEVHRAPETSAALWRSCSVVVRTGCAVAESGALAGWLTTLSWLSAALLVFAGLGVARARGPRFTLKGEV
jgi:hypothetical protein